MIRILLLPHAHTFHLLESPLTLAELLAALEDGGWHPALPPPPIPPPRRVIQAPDLVIIHPLPESSADQPPRRPLTPRQRQVLRLLIQGNPPKVIARRMGISYRTVSHHLLRLRQRLGIPVTTRALLRAYLDGHNPPEDA